MDLNKRIWCPYSRYGKTFTRLWRTSTNNLLPLNVEEGMMIEPTETESKETLDYFIDAMLQIADEVESDPDKVLEAPHTTIIDRLDETTAARKPILKFEDLHQEKL